MHRKEMAAKSFFEGVKSGVESDSGKAKTPEAKSELLWSKLGDSFFLLI